MKRTIMILWDSFSNKVHIKHSFPLCVTGEEASVPLVLKWREKPLLVPNPSEVKRMRTRFEWVRKGDGGGVWPQKGPRDPEVVSICKQKQMCSFLLYILEHVWCLLRVFLPNLKYMFKYSFILIQNKKKLNTVTSLVSYLVKWRWVGFYKERTLGESIFWRSPHKQTK